MELQPVAELVTWLQTAQTRWGDGITYRLDSGALALYQNGKYRAALPLTERPMLTDWADEEA